MHIPFTIIPPIALQMIALQMCIYIHICKSWVPDCTTIDALGHFKQDNYNTVKQFELS